jgi:23S rRNA-/tRNA-specific pseudouridylate synthase
MTMSCWTFLQTVLRDVVPPAGVINDPVGGQPSCTLYETLARFTLPGVPIGKWKSPRFSLVRAEPLTGRYHQIRREF